jgi:hypothetical protein
MLLLFQLILERTHSLVKRGVLGAKALVFLFEPFSDVLESYVPFDLSLLIELNTSLELCQLGLFTLSESALSGPVLNTTAFGV